MQSENKINREQHTTQSDPASGHSFHCDVMKLFRTFASANYRAKLSRTATFIDNNFAVIQYNFLQDGGASAHTTFRDLCCRFVLYSWHSCCPVHNFRINENNC